MLVICILDNLIIIFSKSFEGMVMNLKIEFLRMRKVYLKMNLKKYILFKRKIKYLEHLISSASINADPEKISVVKDWPIPRNKKHLQILREFCSYYHRNFYKRISFNSKTALYAYRKSNKIYLGRKVLILIN